MTGPGSWGSQDWLCVIVPFPPFPAFPLGDFVHLLFSLLCATSAFFTGCVSPMPASLVQLLGEMQSLESNRLHCVVSFFPERSSHAQISDSCLCGYVVNTFFSEPVNFQQCSHDNICSFSGGTNTQGRPAWPRFPTTYLGTPARLLQCHQHWGHLWCSFSTCSHRINEMQMANRSTHIWGDHTPLGPQKLHICWKNLTSDTHSIVFKSWD